MSGARGARERLWPVLALRFVVSAAFYGIVPYALILFPLPAALSALSLAGIFVAGRLLAWPIGRLVDLVGVRRPLLVVSAVTLAALIAELGMSWAAASLLALAGLSVLNPLANIALRTVVAHLVPRNEHPAAFGLLGSVKTMGIAAGPAISGLILVWESHSGAPSTDLQGVLLSTTILVAMVFTFAVGLPDRSHRREAGPAQDDECTPDAGTGLLWLGLVALWAVVWTCLYALTMSLARYFEWLYDALATVSIFFVVQSLMSAGLLALAGRIMRHWSDAGLLRGYVLGAGMPPLALLLAGLWPGVAAHSGALTLALLLASVIAVSEALTVPGIDTLAARGAADRVGRRFGQLTTAEVLGMMGAGGISWLTGLPRYEAAQSEAWLLAGTALAALSLSLAGTIVLAQRRNTIQSPYVRP